MLIIIFCCEYARITRWEEIVLHSFMLKEKAVALLKVRPEEARMVVLMAALFLCIRPHGCRL